MRERLPCVSHEPLPIRLRVSAARPPPGPSGGCKPNAARPGPISPSSPQATQAARLYKCAPQPRPHRRFSPRRAALHLATVPPAMLPPLQGKMVKRKEWQMAEQYVEQLAAARERVVADRRGLAAEVAGPYERGRHEQWRRMIEIQDTIDAIDRAITDERNIKEKGKPVSLVDLLL